jgi:hypothetical protein
MAVREESVRIQKPCPVQLDPARAANGVRSWHCGHCDKAVHVLSNMTESEARTFMAESAGKDVCVTYAVRKDGSIRFAPEPVAAPVVSLVPVSSLMRRRHAAAAAVGLGLALAACAPHENPKHERPTAVAVDAPVVTPPIPVVPVQPPTVVEPDERMVDGEMAPIEPEPRPAGGLRAMPIPDEPCDPPKTTVSSDRPMKRGKMKRIDDL